MSKIKPSETTPEHLYLSRRKFMTGIGALAASAAILAACGPGGSGAAPSPTGASSSSTQATPSNASADQSVSSSASATEPPAPTAWMHQLGRDERHLDGDSLRRMILEQLGIEDPNEVSEPAKKRTVSF